MHAKRFYYKFINISLLFQNKILILLRDTDTQLIKKSIEISQCLPLQVTVNSLYSVQ